MSLHLIKKIHEAPLPTLRGTERIPLLEEGGMEASIHREVLPYAPDAWYVPESVKVGYEISFIHRFYKGLANEVSSIWLGDSPLPVTNCISGTNDQPRRR